MDTTNLHSPLEVIDQSFSAYCNTHRGNECLNFSPESFWGETDMILQDSDLFSDQTDGQNSKFQHIVLNGVHSVSTIAEGSLVRYRCMIHQPLCSELYIGAYNRRNRHNGMFQWYTTKYRNFVGTLPSADEVSEEKHNHIFWDRYLYYCIPIPGETDWVKQLDMLGFKDKEHLKSLNILNQRKFTYTPTDWKSSKILSEKVNFPLPWDALQAFEGPAVFGCIIKIYNKLCQDVTLRSNELYLKANDIVEIIGLYSSPLNIEGKTEFPILHVLKYKILRRWDPFNAHIISLEPHLTYLLSCGPNTAIQLLRSKLKSYISKCIGGDALVAEYLLLAFISNKFCKDIPTAGRFTLNICNLNENLKRKPVVGDKSKYHSLQLFLGVDSTHFLHLCNNLLPIVSGVSMNLKFVNYNEFTSKFVPSTDENDKLESGLLQLANGTFLLVDETLAESGKLNDCGTLNVLALESLISLSSVPYRLQSGQTRYFEMDASLIFLSTQRSMFSDKIDILLPFQQNTGLNIFEETDTLNEAELTQFRRLLLYFKYATTPLKIDQTVVEYIQNYFVEIRQKDSSIKSTDLNIWMALARCYTFSLGQTNLTIAIWNELMDLELKRRTRIMSSC